MALLLVLFGTVGCNEEVQAPEPLVELNPKDKTSSYSDKFFKEALWEFRNSLADFRFGNGFRADSDSSVLVSKVKGLLISSIQFLESHGYYEQDLLADFETLENPNILVFALAVLEVESKADFASSSKDFYSKSMRVNGEDDNLFDCLLRAVGADAIVDYFKGKYVSSYAAKKALIKTFGKVAARLGLSYIGVAIATIEFTNCMWANQIF